MSNHAALSKLPRPFFVLAPMDDVTDTVFRQIIDGCAPPDLYFTEFVNVDGLQSPGRKSLLKKLRFTDGERPIIAQIWGKTPENYYKTAKELVEMGFDGIDINMGCPAKPVVKSGCCSALINNRELASQIIRATQEGADGKIPVSVKTRLGFNNVDLSWHEFLLEHKLNMLTIHGRTKKQMSAVPADWDKIGQIREMRDKIAPGTLIVGNGDVESRHQGEALTKKHQLDGVMVGRGIFHDPYLFAENSPWPQKDKQERIALFRKHVELFAETWPDGERQLPGLNKFCKIYINGFDGAKELREQLMHARSTGELLSLMTDSQ
jgi:tRNA-dihydrouridine synthase